MIIQGLDEPSERKWHNRLVKVIRDHGDICDATTQMINIFGPIVFVELYTQTICVASILVYCKLVCKLNQHKWQNINLK